MQIKRFQARRIHGYLDFDLRFRKDLTFLTGINGSGKTSVIQSIIALISPSFSILANLEFDFIEVEVEHNEKLIRINASRHDDATLLTSSTVVESLAIRPFIPNSDEPAFRTADKESEYYRELEASFSTHPLITHIRDLPTPMFLDLDRRSRAIQEYRTPGIIRPRPFRRDRNIFAFFLSQSLTLATDLAETAYRDSLIALGRIGEELRRHLVLDLLAFETSTTLPWSIGLPSKQELATLKSFRRSVNDLPSILQIPRKEIEERLVPSLNALEEFASSLTSETEVEKILQNRSQDNEKFRALLGWSATRPQLARLLTMVERLKDYSSQKDLLTEKNSRYLKILNGFFKDSNKTVSFTTEGRLQFRMPPDDQMRSMHSLSSGEAQLFVIMTHLFFNPQAQEGNVFIIDEPELSLHIQWQELFVQSVISANPNVQYIMATHSPSIILEKLDNCLDLSRKISG